MNKQLAQVGDIRSPSPKYQDTTLLFFPVRRENIICSVQISSILDPWPRLGRISRYPAAIGIDTQMLTGLILYAGRHLVRMDFMSLVQRYVYGI
jgi:hypothetical protein